MCARTVDVFARVYSFFVVIVVTLTVLDIMLSLSLSLSSLSFLGFFVVV